VNEIYRRILEALLEANNRNTPEEQADYLRSLKPAARALWQAYQQQAGINADAQYDEPAVQAAYMLRYFPSYSQLVFQSLNTIGNVASFNEEHARVAFFGPGPAPELLGVLQSLRQRLPHQIPITATLFDRASNAWQPSRQINVERLLPLIWNGDLITIQERELDFSHAAASQDVTVREVLANADLVIFQNCVNEIPQASQAAFHANAIEFHRLMRPGSVMLFVERRGYVGTLTLLASIRATAIQQQLCSVTMSDEAVLNCRPINAVAPPLLTTHLLVRRDVFLPITPDEYGLVLGADLQYQYWALRRQ